MPGPGAGAGRAEASVPGGQVGYPRSSDSADHSVRCLYSDPPVPRGSDDRDHRVRQTRLAQRHLHYRGYYLLYLYSCPCTLSLSLSLGYLDVVPVIAVFLLGILYEDRARFYY